MFPISFNDAILHEYFNKVKPDSTPVRLLTNDSTKSIYYCISLSDGLWLKIEKIRRYKNKARLFGDFWQSGKIWNGYFDFPLTNDFQQKTLDQIEAILNRYQQ